MAALAVVALIAGCGGGDEGLASLAPPDTPLYAEFTRPQGPPEGADYGFSLGRGALDRGAEVGVFDDRLVAVSGGSAAAALDPGATLADAAAYQEAVEALGEDMAPGLFVDLPSLLAVAEQNTAADDPGLGRLAPYLARLDSLVAGATVDDGLELSRITLTLAD